MNEFNNETYNALLEKATKELKDDSPDYESNFENAWNYISAFTHEKTKVNILNEIKTQIELLSKSDRFSKDNLLLVRDICISFEIIRPKKNDNDKI